MTCYYLITGADLLREPHYGISVNDEFVLVQLQDEYGGQARVKMLSCEARHLASLLNAYADELDIQTEKDNDDL
jgi:hypothetical protein